MSSRGSAQKIFGSTDRAFGFPAGWNACSSCYGDAGSSRNYLVLPGFASGRIYALDVQKNPRAPTIAHIVEPEEILKKTVRCMLLHGLICSMLVCVGAITCMSAQLVGKTEPSHHPGSKPSRLSRQPAHMRARWPNRSTALLPVAACHQSAAAEAPPGWPTNHTHPMLKQWEVTWPHPAHCLVQLVGCLLKCQLAYCCAHDCATGPTWPHTAHSLFLLVGSLPECPPLLSPQNHMQQGLTWPHTAHCLGTGEVVVSTLGDANGDGKGAFLVLDQVPLSV